MGTETVVVASEAFKVERKLFRLDLCRNAKGAFVKIQETVGGRVTTVILPLQGLTQLGVALEKIGGAALAMAAEE